MNSTPLRTRTSRHIDVMNGRIAEGKQAVVDKAFLRETGVHGVLKTFVDKAIGRSITEARTELLMSFDLPSIYRRIVTPTEIVAEGTRAAHFAPMAPGVHLLNLLESEEPQLSVPQAIVIAIVISYVIDRLHDLGIAHGDIHDCNFLIHFPANKPNRIEVYFIDLDSFYHPRVPCIPYFGNEFYVAPELLDGSPNHPGHPTIEGDLYSLTVLIHYLLLLVHPANGFENINERQRAMYDLWFLDPYNLRSPLSDVMYQPAILNSKIASLIRRGLSRNPKIRPRAGEWVEALLKTARNDLHMCPRCTSPIMNDHTKTTCPECGVPPPRVCVVLPSGQRIPVDMRGVDLGRQQVQSPFVSRQHVRFRVNGFDIRMESVSQTNSTFKKVNGLWQPIPAGQPLSIEPGDKFRLGDQEIVVMEDKRPCVQVAADAGMRACRP